MIDIKDIKKIQNIFDSSSISEIEIRNDRNAVRLKLSHAGKKRAIQNEVSITAGEAPLKDTRQAQKTAAETKPDIPVNELRSQWIGFFTRLNPKTGENYIKLRDVVKKGDLVGHVRVLGVLQDIRAEINGKVKEVLVEEGQPIEYGQPVMRFEIQV